MKKQYKITVGGELADRILDSMPDTQWLNKLRKSIVVFVVETEGDAKIRDECIDMGHSPREIDEEAYMLNIMTMDEGTFPDMVARDVTGKGWTL